MLTDGHWAVLGPLVEACWPPANVALRNRHHNETDVRRWAAP